MDKKGTVRERSVNQEAYHSESYLGKKQWASFLFQVKTIYKTLPPASEHSILEIGRGSGFVNAILKELGYETASLDINDHLNPTYVGDISAKNFRLHRKYDFILCAEVLEHIPFEKFDICLENISNLTDGMVLITLPDFKFPFKLSLSIGGSVGEHSLDFYIPRIIEKQLPEVHFWELNYANYCKTDEITVHISKYFDVLENGRLRENPYHWYFLLKKRISSEAIRL